MAAKPKASKAAPPAVASSPMPSPAELLLAEGAADTVPIRVVAKSELEAATDRLGPAARAWLKATGFEPGPGRHALLPDADGSLAAVLLVSDPGDEAGPLALGSLAASLPAGRYRLEGRLDPDLAVLGWLLGSYRFDRYRSGKPATPRLLAAPPGLDRDGVLAAAESVWMARDLINTPASDMGPAELEEAARALARRIGATASSVVGDELLAANFPMIHAVGRASTRPPRLVDLAWGRADAPKVTLVGKGICFDTGGLNVKPGDSMTLMKKDMGGAATALALGAMIARAGLDVRLRVLLPIAENSISGNAFRPGDVLRSREGMTVEIGNTDAEGRLVLADAMALAVEEKPDILFTFATLTGAARVALGPDLPPFYCDDDLLAASVLNAGLEVDDPVWRMPFWAPYDKLLKSPIADVNHISGGPFAGSVTAAMFLKRFARGAGAYGHFDIYAWVAKAKPGKPEGGEPTAARAVYAALAGRYGRRP